METAIIAAIPAVIAAMGGILKLVLSSLERIEQRQEAFLGNHMSATTRALTELTGAITRHESRSQLELLRLRAALEKSGITVPPEDKSDE